jgi:hypothetical protein
MSIRKQVFTVLCDDVNKLAQPFRDRTIEIPRETDIEERMWDAYISALHTHRARPHAIRLGPREWLEWKVTNFEYPTMTSWRDHKWRGMVVEPQEQPGINFAYSERYIPYLAWLLENEE